MMDAWASHGSIFAKMMASAPATAAAQPVDGVRFLFTATTGGGRHQQVIVSPAVASSEIGRATRRAVSEIRFLDPGQIGGFSDDISGFATASFRRALQSYVPPARRRTGDSASVGRPQQDAFLEVRVYMSIRDDHGGASLQGVAGRSIINEGVYLGRLPAVVPDRGLASRPAVVASRSAIDSLTSTAYDKSGGTEKESCSICQEDMLEGDRVTELPCSHWFHSGGVAYGNNVMDSASRTAVALWTAVAAASCTDGDNVMIGYIDDGTYRCCQGGGMLGSLGSGDGQPGSIKVRLESSPTSKVAPVMYARAYGEVRRHHGGGIPSDGQRPRQDGEVQRPQGTSA